MSKPKALGIHVFAGGFTLGLQKHMDVDTHLEVHDLGHKTATQKLGLNVIRSEAKNWPSAKTFSDCILAAGNPRCTAFSCVTADQGRSMHGAFGAQTRDAIELCEYAAGNFDFVVWESVQQAYSVGKPLLDRLYTEFFKPKGYRLCHLFVNSASFGNVQNRRRYFFVAYRDCYKFNVQAPPMPKYKPALWDALAPLMNEETIEQEKPTSEMTPNTSSHMLKDDKDLVDKLPNGWNLNTFGKFMYEHMSERYKFRWRNRNSEMPFGMHGIFRTSATRFAPTLHSGSRHHVHPVFNRCFTAAEFSAIMGWPSGLIPAGHDVVAQLAKGIVPAVGQWIAEQVILSSNHHWGTDDWESQYDWRTNRWLGKSTVGQEQKTFNLTEYYPHTQDWSRFPECILRPTVPVPDHIQIKGALDNRILY